MHRAKLFKAHHGNAILKDKTITPAPTPNPVNLGIIETAVGASNEAPKSQQQALFNSLMFANGNKP